MNLTDDTGAAAATGGESQRDMADVLASHLEGMDDPDALDVLDALGSAGLMLARPDSGNPASDEYLAAFRRPDPDARP